MLFFLNSWVFICVWLISIVQLLLMTVELNDFIGLFGQISLISKWESNRSTSTTVFLLILLLFSLLVCLCHWAHEGSESSQKPFSSLHFGNTGTVQAYWSSFGEKPAASVPIVPITRLCLVDVDPVTCMSWTFCFVRTWLYTTTDGWDAHCTFIIPFALSSFAVSSCITTYKKTPPPVPPRTSTCSTASKPYISITAQSSTESAQVSHKAPCDPATASQCHSYSLASCWTGVSSLVLVALYLNQQEHHYTCQICMFEWTYYGL